MSVLAEIVLMCQCQAKHGLSINISINSKVQQSLEWPDRPLGLQEIEASRNCRRWKACLPPRRYPWYSVLLEAESTPGLINENSMTPSGIEIVTFDF
jgi:hypothetical protein